jgi:multicomponent Na+:H+ antiporter subunit A
LRRDAVAWAAVAAAALSFLACLGGWLAGGFETNLPWAPTLGLRLEFSLDGLAALYGLIDTGIALAVFAYAAVYMQLQPKHRPADERRRFWPWMVLFMVAMLGLACSQDLILLFLFFDLTAIASYFLIGFDRERREARGAALMAMLVTGASAACILIAGAMLYAEHGTFSLPAIFEAAEPGTTTTVAGALVAVAALAKSAQVPLHFWLPRAMAAPTPASAYLHSAAMVAAGVLVIGRVHPLLALSEPLLDGLLVVGLVSIIVGGALALAQDDLKQVLAHSTISQYGYVVTLYGIAGAKAAGAAAFYVLTHAIAKSSLFMTAGAVTTATGESRLSRLGGLAREMPLLAVASGVAAATLAALPLTLGFFKDELFFAAARDEGWLMGVLAVVAAALTFAYIGRFWWGIFAGPTGARAKPIPALLILPACALAAVAVIGGVVAEPFAELAGDAATVTNAAPVSVAPGYHLDLRPETLMALAAWALGAIILLLSGARQAVVGALARIGDRFGPRRAYRGALELLHTASDGAHRREVRDLRNSIAAVFLPAGLLIACGFLATPTAGAYEVGPIHGRDLPIIALLGLVVFAGLVVARDQGHVRMVLALSVLGFGLAAVYAVIGAPDVALVAVVVESVLTLVFLGVLARLPAGSQRLSAPRSRHENRRNVVVGVLAAAGAFATVWGALSRPTVAPSVAADQIRLAPEAHGGDVVTVILADFRGLDTLGEITVLAIAVFGAAALMRRGRLW